MRHRFHIAHDALPYIILLKKQRIYVYHNEIFDVESLWDFAVENYHLADVQGKVPVLSGFWDEVKHFWNDEVEQKGGALHVMLMMDSNRQIWFSAILLVYGLPILTVYIFVLLMRSAFSGEEKEIREKRIVVEAKNN